MSDKRGLAEIGRIVRIQIQRTSLKAGERPNRYYDPAPLLAVERLMLEAGGCVGVTASGERIIDVHHAEHPETKNVRGLNGISVNFTSHYRMMRDQFGTHLSDGVAGENILVEADAPLALDDLGETLVVETAGGHTVTLSALTVAAPCVEFSRFANIGSDRLASDELRATLQFLDDGRRGFYAALAPDTPEAAIAAGDRVFAQRRG